MKKIILILPPVPRCLFPPACALLVLFSGCSWIQAFPENFRLSLKRPAAPATVVPVMQVRVRMIYPDETKTVGDAIGYMLEPHSYRRAYRAGAGEAIAERTFINNHTVDPVSLNVAMQRLIGEDGQVLLDRNRKLYTFQTKKPDESSVVFTDLTTTPVAASGVGDQTASSQEGRLQMTPALQHGASEKDQTTAPPQEQPDRSVQDIPEKRFLVEEEALRDNVTRLTRTEDGEMPAENREFCYSIQFKNKAMLSGIVQDYFLRCGFDDVYWRLGDPGRYADYRLLRNMSIPLPKGHEDLIKLLQTRFGVKTVIHDNNRVEFYDEKNLL